MIVRSIKIIIIFPIFYIYAQTESEPVNNFNYQLSSERYFSNEDGQIMMKVNVWGHVESPGGHLVYDGIDFASLISIVGGPKTGANLKKVRLYREKPDRNGKIVYNINFDQFIKSGDRTNFIKINPNDTIIIPQRLSNTLLNQIGTVNTLFSLIMIYLQIQAYN
tara:strand:- start:122 stop:613 length:492 start_codon:yes stop_codon:yes gene_type:complete